MTETARSVFDCLIRLTDERWEHILRGHPELKKMKAEILAAISNPQRVMAGAGNEFLAVSEIAKGRFLIVAYVEGEDGPECEGFIATAFKTTKMNSINQRDQIWP